MGVGVRLARPEDVRFVWEVNNEASVRKGAIRQRPIPYVEHEPWFAARLEDPWCVFLIGTLAADDIGVARFDLDTEAGRAAIGVALPPAHRKLGLGSKLIEIGTSRVFELPEIETVVARIRRDNVMSQRAFEKAGYTRRDAETVEGVDVLRYEIQRPDRLTHGP